MKARKTATGTIGMNVVDHGSGPAVLLCHGFPETSASWRHQIDGLARAGFRAIAPDMRGYGGTEAPGDVEMYNVFELVGDMVALLDALDVPEALIVGNDWGATVAWQAAQLRPDRFSAVAGMGVPLMGRAPKPPTELFPRTQDEEFYTIFFQEVGVAEVDLDRNVRRTLLKMLWGASASIDPAQEGDSPVNPFGMVSRRSGMLDALPEYAGPPDWIADDHFDLMVEAFETTGFSGGLNYYRNLDRNWRLQSALVGSKVHVPSLFMAGERDPGLKMPGMQDIIDNMSALATQLRKPVIVPDAGHWLPLESPDEVTSRLVAFAREVTSTR